MAKNYSFISWSHQRTQVVDANTGEAIAEIIGKIPLVEARAITRLFVAAPKLKLACEGALTALVCEPHVDKQQAIDFIREVLEELDG